MDLNRKNLEQGGYNGEQITLYYIDKVYRIDPRRVSYRPQKGILDTHIDVDEF